MILLSTIKSTKKDSEKKHVKKNQNLSEEKKTKGKNKAQERDYNFTEEEKEYRNYHRECNKNLPKEQKRKLVE